MYQQHLYLSICLVTSTSLLNQPRFVFRHRHHHHYHCHHYIQAIWGRWSVIAFYCDMPAVKVAARAVVKRLNGDFVKSFNKYDHSLWRWEISARGEPQQIWLEEFGQRLSQPGISATWISLNLSSRIHRGSFESCIEEHLLELGTKQMLSILNVERSAIAQASTFTHYQCYQCYNVTILQCYNVTNATNATQHRPPNWDQPDITPILPFSPLPCHWFFTAPNFWINWIKVFPAAVSPQTAELSSNDKNSEDPTGRGGDTCSKWISFSTEIGRTINQVFYSSNHIIAQSWWNFPLSHQSPEVVCLLNARLFRNPFHVRPKSSEWSFDFDCPLSQESW